MKHYSQLILILFLFIGGWGCKKNSNDIVYKKEYIDEIKKVRKDVAVYMAQNFVPGANMAVSIDGELVYSEGLGLASKDLNVKATRKTKFRIGEVSSLFTNLLYHKLVEEGVLVPDSSVQFYFPEFPDKEYKLTLFQLANEISGLQPPYNDEELKQLNTSIQQGINLFKDKPLETPPGGVQEPNCYNYNLLAAIMEKATGKKFRELLPEYLTDTLHFENTIIDNPFVTIKERSDFFEPNIISQVVNARFYDLRVTAPSKGLLSNAEDLVKLGNTMLYGEYLSNETMKDFFEPIKLYNDNPSTMVNGWMVLSDNLGRKFYGREGTIVGGKAAVLIYPEEKLVIGYACNISSSITDSPVFRIADVFLNPKEGLAKGMVDEK